MKHIQEAVRAYLQCVSGVKTVSDRTRVRGEYPLLAVSVRENGTTLIDGGKQAEHRYEVTVTAVSDRQRDGNTSLLSGLPAMLLRGVPMDLPAGESGSYEKRVLHPLDIHTAGEELTFSLELCVPLPPPSDNQLEGPGIMQRLHFDV